MLRMFSLHFTRKENIDYRQLIAETQVASTNVRQKALQKFLNADKVFPDGLWGENLWCLTALYLNERTAEANEKLYTRAKQFLDKVKEKKLTDKDLGHIPETTRNWPFSFFSMADYFRTYALFNSKSTYFPGRLELRTEKLMKAVFF